VKRFENPVKRYFPARFGRRKMRRAGWFVNKRDHILEFLRVWPQLGHAEAKREVGALQFDAWPTVRSAVPPHRRRNLYAIPDLSMTRGEAVPPLAAGLNRFHWDRVDPAGSHRHQHGSRGNCFACVRIGAGNKETFPWLNHFSFLDSFHY
jgi:hypothetical protein